ncbi:MAG: hypothetical protein AAB393_11395 [Bacteroidota bacterium]
MDSWKQEIGVLILTMGLIGCNLFEPREPEQPSQSSSDFRPPTTPEIVIANLQSSIAQKNIQNYINCFADPARARRGFFFVPSPEASAQYPSVLSAWTYAEEHAYMQNLISKAAPNGFSSLLLTRRSSVVSADSVVWSYDYVFTFQHTEAGFPSTARGNLQFTLGVDNSTWSIYTWSDFKTTPDVTWSSFKGRFSN